MISISKTKVMNVEAAIRGMRNPLESWGKSDSAYDEQSYSDVFEGKPYILGPNDWDLAMRLRNAGSDHRKFMRMILVSCDIAAPIYWWKEYDTYKVGTVRNSCSTMHKIHAHEFTRADFSCNHIYDAIDPAIDKMNYYRERYLETKDHDDWYAMIQYLPSSYIQLSTVVLNYEVLLNMYNARASHKLQEWHIFCDWIETLPYSQLITGVI